MNDTIYQNDNYDTKVRKQAPYNLEIQECEKKAIVESLYLAKRTIDNMHSDEREVHFINRKEIREIENDIRQKLADSIKTGSWYNIELTAIELMAIEQGLTDRRFNDNFDMDKRHQKLCNLLTWHTNPRN